MSSIFSYTSEQLHQAATIVEGPGQMARAFCKTPPIATFHVGEPTDSEGYSTTFQEVLDSLQGDTPVLIRQCRRTQVTSALAMYAAHQLITKPGYSIMVVNRLFNEKGFVDLVLRYLAQIPEPWRIVPTSGKRTQNVFSNGSSLVVATLKERVCGQEVDEVIIDQAAGYTESTIAQQFLLDARACLRKKGRFIMASANNLADPKNEFNRLWEKGPENWVRLDVKWWNSNRFNEGLMFTKNKIELPDPCENETRNVLVKLGWTPTNGWRKGMEERIWAGVDNKESLKAELNEL